MAILNFSNTYKQITDLGYKINDSTSKDYIKLFFTGDKHIVSHGVDYLADYVNGIRGLVPSTTVTGKQVLLDNGWGNLTIDMLPYNEIMDVSSTTTILSSKQVADYVQKEIGAGFSANDAMVFKGVVNNTNPLPNSGYSAGWTYRVISAGTYAGTYCEIGDLIIAKSDAVEGQTSINNDHWFVVQTNIDGTSTITVNGSSKLTYFSTKSGDNFSFYAPTTHGTANQILLSNGNASPVWADQSVINAGKFNGYTTSTLLGGVTAVDGSIQVTVAGETKTGTATGNWNINAASANKVNNSLKLAGGLNFTETGATTYDGSAIRTINLLPATTSSIGGVVIGNNITVDSEGKISLTKQNIVDALEYVPSGTTYTVVSTSVDGLAPKIITTNTKTIDQSYYLLAYDGTAPSWFKLGPNAFSNTWRNIKVNGTDFLNNDPSSGTIDFVGGDNVTLTANNGKLTISAIDTTYGLATSTDNGLMSADDFKKLLSIATGAEVNQNAFSNIIVGDTTVSANSKTDSFTITGTNISVGANSNTKTINLSVSAMQGATSSSASTLGLVPVANKGDQLKFLRADGTWQIPVNDNTWRPIKVGTNTLSDNTTALTVSAGNNIEVGLNNGVLTISSSYVNTTYSAGVGLDLQDTTFLLKKASVNEIGGIKVASIKSSAVTTETITNAAGRNYGIEIDSSGKAFVNVPWQDTNIRDIKIAGTSIGTATLNIIPSEDVIISWDKDSTDFSDGEATISFGLSWYNISTESYETA